MKNIIIFLIIIFNFFLIFSENDSSEITNSDIPENLIEEAKDQANLEFEKEQEYVNSFNSNNSEIIENILIENTNLEEENKQEIEEEKSYFDTSFILFYVSMFFNLLCLILIIILFRRKI